MPQANFEGTAFVSAARTATATSDDLKNHNYTYLTIFVDATVEADTASVTPSVQIKEIEGGAYFTIWTAAAAIEAVGQTAYQLGPGLLTSVDEDWTDTGNVVIPRTFRIVMTHADSDALTYSVTYSLSV